VGYNGVVVRTPPQGVAVRLTSHVPLLGAPVQLWSCLVPYSVDVTEWKSAVTGGLKGPALGLLKKTETVMWRTSLLVMTNMTLLLDSAYIELKQRQNLYVHTFFTFTAAILAAILDLHTLYATKDTLS